MSADPDPGVLMQYKELIRAQDQRISQISQGNLYLQQELTTAKAQIEELNTTIQTLQDQNSLIKAQKTCNGPTSEVVVPNYAKHFEVKNSYFPLINMGHFLRKNFSRKIGMRKTKDFETQTRGVFLIF